MNTTHLYMAVYILDTFQFYPFCRFSSFSFHHYSIFNELEKKVSNFLFSLFVCLGPNVNNLFRICKLTINLNE